MASFRLQCTTTNYVELCPRQSSITTRQLRSIKCGSFSEKFKDFQERAGLFAEKVKFENWAPKSSRAWRLRQAPIFDNVEEDEQQFTASLEKRLRQAAEDKSSSDMYSSDSVDTSSVYNDPSRESFSEADDEDIAASLTSRMAAAAENSEDLTAEELSKLIVLKYGKRFDLTIARRTFAGKDFVSLNVMWVHLDQRTFPMTKEQYMDKMDGMCILINAWNRQDEVRTFFNEKAKPKNGMPARPIVGTAVALQLDLPPEVVQEWIGSRLG